MLVSKTYPTHDQIGYDLFPMSSVLSMTARYNAITRSSICSLQPCQSKSRTLIGGNPTPGTFKTFLTEYSSRYPLRKLLTVNENERIDSYKNGPAITIVSTAEGSMLVFEQEERRNAAW